MNAALATLAVLIGQPTNLPQPKEYVFVRDTDRRVGITKGGDLHVGTLDERGHFHETERVKNSPGSHQMKLVGDECIPKELSGPYTDLPNHGPAYELHDGKLAPGCFDWEGKFVCAPGEFFDWDGKKTRMPPARSIPFEDYKPGPDSAPIWNLPGYFKAKSDLERRREWLAKHLGEKPDYAKEKERLDSAWTAKYPPGTCLP